MEEIREILQNIAQSTLATTSAAEAVKKAVEDKKSSTTDWLTLIAKVNMVDYESQEEEIKAFREWPWVFAQGLSAVDEGYMKGLKETHGKPEDKIDMDVATTEEKDQVRQALWIVGFTDERKGTAIGESCGGH